MSRVACLLLSEGERSSPSACRRLLEVALAHSPRVEEGAGCVYLDARGLGTLWGDDDRLARRLAAAAVEAGLRVQVAVADSRVAALCACRLGAAPPEPAPRSKRGPHASRPLHAERMPGETTVPRAASARRSQRPRAQPSLGLPAEPPPSAGLTEPLRQTEGALRAEARSPGGHVTVVPPGGDAAYLSTAPVSLLDLDDDIARRLDRWGIRTFGQLAALPAAGLFERLGSEGVRLQRLARGDDRAPLRPWTPAAVLEESAELHQAVDALGPLAELVRQLAGRIAGALVAVDRSADQLEWICHLDGGARHEGRLAPASPVNDGRALAALVCRALETRPPRAPVRALTLRARPVRAPAAQAALGEPPRPSPRLLTAALARIAALVGKERVGAPRLLDSHRPDAVDLAPDPRPARPPTPGGERRPTLGLRRFRPPVPALVTLLAGRPVELRSRWGSARIVTSAGPWRASGEWWTEAPWLHDEWDVELAGPTRHAAICRLAHDGSAWWLEGVYD